VRYSLFCFISNSAPIFTHHTLLTQIFVSLPCHRLSCCAVAGAFKVFYILYLYSLFIFFISINLRCREGPASFEVNLWNDSWSAYKGFLAQVEEQRSLYICARGCSYYAYTWAGLFMYTLQRSATMSLYIMNTFRYSG